MSEGDPLRIRLTLDSSATPLSAIVMPDGGAEQRVEGWIELFSALEGLVERDGSKQTSTGGES